MKNNLLQNDNPQYILQPRELECLNKILKAQYGNGATKMAEAMYAVITGDGLILDNETLRSWVMEYGQEILNTPDFIHRTDISFENGRAHLWKLQYESAKQILQHEQMTASDYFFFFHLYVGLVNGNEQGQRLADKLNTTRASSIIYKNEIFTNHLIYVVLLFLANPDDSNKHKWNKGQLKKFLEDMTNVLGETNQPNKLVESLKNEIGVFIKRLENNDGFPNAARHDFENRLANTLGQLDKMRTLQR